MTQTATARVFLKYDHPSRSNWPSSDTCKAIGWIAPVDEQQPNQPADPTDQSCPLCGIEGRFDRKVYELVEGEKPDRNTLPPAISPDDILPGYPVISTNQGYQLTS